MAKTVHIIPSEKGWAVKRVESRRKSAFFATKKAAIARARFMVKETGSGQIVIHSKAGRFEVFEVHGLPKIQKSHVKSSLGSRKIEMAVSNLVRKRLASA